MAPGHSEDMISIFSPDKEDVVYDQAAWWSDSWDPMECGVPYDFRDPFFAQLRALWKRVPDIALVNNNCVNSEYCSITEENKNCYLVIGGDFNENTMYSSFTFHCKESVDCHWVSKGEYNYETIDCIQCTRLLYSRYCEGCYDSAFLFNCRNCHDCFGCTNLTNKSYCFFNQQYSKEEYANRVREVNMGSAAVVAEIKKRFEKESMNYPRRFARVIRSVNSTGDNLEGAKNCKRAFEVFDGSEDSRYLWLIYSPVKDCYDTDHSGLQTELCVDSSTVYPGNRIFYSRLMRSCHDMYYSYNCHNSSFCFGCVGLRNKNYCILNVQYTTEEYEKMIVRIREHMDIMPYKDSAGITYAFGEFFPGELSQFCYNETVAQELFPLSDEEAKKRGFRWKEAEQRSYTPTISCDVLQDDIQYVRDSIITEIIECASASPDAQKGRGPDPIVSGCAGAFRIIQPELAFYKHMKIPLPRLCPNCRHHERINKRNPLTLWKRLCQCAGDAAAHGTYRNSGVHQHGNTPCSIEFDTTYAPDRQEIVYCEQCYQAEVA